MLPDIWQLLLTALEPESFIHDLYSRSPCSNRKCKTIRCTVGKHWAHNLPVQEEGDVFHITFAKDARGADWPGDAVVTLAPETDSLVCRIKASAEAQREGLKGAVERHVDRFAFREAPLTYPWQDSQG